MFRTTLGGRSLGALALAAAGSLASATPGGFPADTREPVQAARPTAETAPRQRIVISPRLDAISLCGPDAVAQALVTRHERSFERDETRGVRYTVKPADVATCGPDGLLRPLRDGRAELVAESPDGLHATTVVVVGGCSEPPTVDFANDIVPIFTKLGCNGGGCHGKSGGQNGFRLSLLGFKPHDDYEFLVREDRGRRLFPAIPGESLLLTKATAKLPHGGGKRMNPDSAEYRTLCRWISQGMPPAEPNSPRVTGIVCEPAGRVMSRHSEQQIAVLARYSDGHTVDVTRSVLYEANDVELAQVSPTGLVRTLDLAGEVAIMARFQGQVAVFRATVPMGAPGALPATPMPAPTNVVDAAVFGKLIQLGLPISERCDDATFLRRVTLDIAGRLPTPEEVRAFLEETDPSRRRAAVDRLLASDDYADFFANKWSLLLRNKARQNEDAVGMYAFHRWVRGSLARNKPYDQFVRELLTATGDADNNPAVIWYREVDQVEEQVEDTSQLFLGLRIQCARCHHHPFEKWSEDDYYGLAAYFSRLRSEPVPAARTGAVSRDRRYYYEPGRATAKNPISGRELVPTGLGAAPETLGSDRDPREALADWVVDTENPFFARAVVNRYWKHFLGRGIVEPEDDLRETNPPTNPELLDGLAGEFAAGGYDLKGLVRTIVLSETYQRSSQPVERNSTDKKNFSRFYPKRLPAEVLFDAVHQVTSAPAPLPGLPAGSRAVQLVDASSGPYFLQVFGQPQGDTACECERSQESSLAQSLHLLNSSEVHAQVTRPDGRAALLAAETSRPLADRVTDLYFIAYGRTPRPEELAIAVQHIEGSGPAARVAFEDLLWALINTKEFLFNH